MPVSLIVGEEIAIARKGGRRHPPRGNSGKNAATADGGEEVAEGWLGRLCAKEVADVCFGSPPCRAMAQALRGRHRF